MRYIPLLIAFLLSACSQPRTLSDTEVLANAVEYLWSQQQSDGGWHSPTHGIASGGESWTPFVLYHLMQVPDSVFKSKLEDKTRALDYIRDHVTPEGIVGHGDPVVADYPNYATSYALRCLLEVGSPRDSALVHAMANYLISQQISESRGFGNEHPAYGGWGFGEKNLPPDVPGHVDLSHTRRVTEALAAYGQQSSGSVVENDHMLDTIMQRVQVYLATVQRRPDRYPDEQVPYDGGFHASPVVEGVNKGGRAEATDSTAAYYRSYATATSDGLLALLAAGVPPSDSRVQDAASWLQSHPGFLQPTGIPEGSMIRWDDVMFFYNLSSLAEAFDSLDLETNWRSQVVDILRDHQYPDGHFENQAGAPNKEDDPLIATTLAVNALLSTLDML